MHLLVYLIICTQISSSLLITPTCIQIQFSCASDNNLYCTCDKMCPYYDNCCFDAEDQIGHWTERRIENEEYKSILQSSTCERIEYNVKSPKRVFMVSSCPESWIGSTDVRRKCQQQTTDALQDLLPVFDIELGVIFKNRHCAVCHGRSNYNPLLLEMVCYPDQTYELSTSLTITDVLMFKIQSKHCSKRFKLPDDINVTFRYCYDIFNYTIKTVFDVVNTSSCENRVFSPLVLINTEPVSLYRNMPCFHDVYGLNITTLLPHLVCFFVGDGYNMEGHLLTSLIDFTSLFDYRQDETRCKQKEILVSNKMGCQRLHCPAGSEPSGGKCVTFGLETQYVFLDLLFDLRDKETEIMVRGKIADLLHLLMHAVNQVYRVSLYHFHIGNGVNLIEGIQKRTGDSCFIIKANVPIQVGDRVVIKDIALLRTLVNNTVRNFTEGLSEYGSLAPIDDVENMSCDCNMTVAKPLYVVEPFTTDKGLPCPAVKIIYDSNESISDNWIRNQSNTTSGNLSYLTLGEIIIAPLDIINVDGDSFVCVDTLLSKIQPNDNKINKYNTFHRYRSIINMVCSSISITCLVYCLVQYCAIPLLRDGKSDLFIVLIVFLLLSQTCFLMLANVDIAVDVCEWLGIYHHFTWLGSFVFMFLFLYRLNSDIRSLQTYSKRERSFSTLKYTLIGIAIPVSIVICTKIVNLIASPMTQWYGGKLCFLSEVHASLIAFVIPVFLILCGNVILFICILRYISSSSVSNNSNKPKVILFMKISTIMGLSWIIGLVAVLLGSAELSFAFEVLSNLQSMFVTFSFTCTSRVRKHYTECFNAKSNRATNECIDLERRCNNC